MAGRKKQGDAGLIATIDQQVLTKALAAVSGALPRRSQIPILDTVLIEAGVASLTLTTTNLDQEASIQVAAVIDQQGSLCIDAKPAMAIMGRMKGDLTLTQDATNLNVIAGRARASHPTLPPEDFQKFSEVIGAEFEIAPGALASGIGSVIHAVSVEETRYYLGGDLPGAGSRERSAHLHGYLRPAVGEPSCDLQCGGGLPGGDHSAHGADRYSEVVRASERAGHRGHKRFHGGGFRAGRMLPDQAD